MANALPNRVVEYPLTRQRAPATVAFQGAVNNGLLTHVGNPALARHLAACVAKETAFGTW